MTLTKSKTISKIYYFNVFKLLFLLAISIFHSDKILYSFVMIIYILYFLMNTTFLEYKKVYNSDIVGLIFCNVNEQMNNVISLYHLFNGIKNKSQNFKSIYIVFPNEIDSSDSETIESKKMLLKKFKLIDFSYNLVNNKINNTKIVFLTTNELNNIKNIYFDVFVQLTSSYNLKPKFFKNNIINKKIIFGNYDVYNMGQKEVKYIFSSLGKEVLYNFDMINILPRNLKLNFIYNLLKNLQSDEEYYDKFIFNHLISSEENTINFFDYIRAEKPNLLSVDDMLAMHLFLHPEIEGIKFDNGTSDFFNHQLNKYYT